MADVLGGLGNLGGLGDLVGGLSKFMPQDDPNVKTFNAQKELSDLQKQEADIFSEIGRKIYERDGAKDFPAEAEKLKLIQSNITAAQEKLDATQNEAKAAEAAKQQAEAARTCPNCGTVNPEGVNFCQECGTKLGAPAKAFCPQCGAENPPGTKFCGNCGAKMGE
ncbi:MAG: zinc ribbon domain-containing protein [Clostridiales bacterium]|nr:zinc ribbon domain-containing protein [Clostridiales bacterium]